MSGMDLEGMSQHVWHDRRTHATWQRSHAAPPVHTIAASGIDGAWPEATSQSPTMPAPCCLPAQPSPCRLKQAHLQGEGAQESRPHYDGQVQRSQRVRLEAQVVEHHIALVDGHPVDGFGERIGRWMGWGWPMCTAVMSGGSGGVAKGWGSGAPSRVPHLNCFWSMPSTYWPRYLLR